MLDDYCSICKDTGLMFYSKSIMVEYDYKGPEWDRASGCKYYTCARCKENNGNRINVKVLGSGCWNGFRTCSQCGGATTTIVVCEHGKKDAHRYCSHNFTGQEHSL